MAHTWSAGQLPAFSSSEAFVDKNIDEVVDEIAIEVVGGAVVLEVVVVVGDVDKFADVVVDEVSMMGISVVDVSCVPRITDCIQSRLAVTLENTSGYPGAEQDEWSPLVTPTTV